MGVYLKAEDSNRYKSQKGKFVHPSLGEEHAHALKIADAAIKLVLACQSISENGAVQFGCFLPVALHRSLLTRAFKEYSESLNSSAQHN